MATTTSSTAHSAARVNRSSRRTTAAASLGAAGFLPFGLWAMVAPRSFFERLAEFDPYNQHLIQDIGAFQLGLGAVLLVAALRPFMDGLAIALLGVGVGAAAHAVSHVVGRDLGGNPTTDIPLFTMIAVILLVAGVARAKDAGSGQAP